MNDDGTNTQAIDDRPTGAPAFAGLDGVVARNAWYRDRYSTVLRIAAIAMIVAAIEACVIAVLIYSTPEPKYFAVDSTGHVVSIVPVDKPLLSNDALTQFAADSARMAYSLDFVNYKGQMEAIRDRFNTPAFKGYVEAMSSSGNLKAIEDNRMIMAAQTEPAVITKSSVDPSGYYTWEVEVPLTVTQHYGGTQSRTQRLRVILTISRVDNRFRPESGVVITRFISALG